MAIEISDLTKKENSILNEIVKLATEVDNSESVKKKARFYALLKKIKDMVEYHIDLQKPLLLEEKVEFFYPEEDLKVIYQEGRKVTQINAPILVEDFIEQMREDDLKKIVSIKETNLKTLPDGETLIKKYKIELEEKATPSIKVSSLSKEDKKRLQEEK